MKTLFAIVGTFALCLQLTAQPYFNELYRTDTNTATIFRSIVTTDTAWYITGVTVVPTPTPHNAGFFTRLNSTGNIEVLKVYTDTLRNLELWNDALIATNNGNLAIVGRNQMDSGFFLTIFDVNGDTLLYRHYGQEISNAITVTQIQQDSEDNYYVLAILGISGVGDGNKVSVIKIDALGNKVDQFNFPSPDPFCIYKTASDLQLLPNNHFIVSSTIYGPCPAYYPPDDSCRGRTWIFEADETGAIVWQYLSPALGRVVTAPKLTLTKDGGIVFSGQEKFIINSNSYIAFNERQYIGKLNNNHELAWEYTNPYIGAAYFSRSVELADGSILVCGRIAQHLTTDSLRYAAVITKFSANGDSLGTQFYYRLSDYFHSGSKVGDHVEHYFQDMVMLPDSSLVMVGEVIDNWTPSPTAGYWAWVVHTDKYGCVEQETCFPVGIASPLPPPKEGVIGVYMKVYPNPARDYVTFAYSMPSKTEAILLVITDPTGKEITQLPFTNLSGELLWDTRTIPTGLYYYTVLSGTDRLASGTVSIVK